MNKEEIHKAACDYVDRTTDSDGFYDAFTKGVEYAQSQVNKNVLLADVPTCDHNWIDGRVTCGTEVCTKCNDARLKQTVLSNSVCKGDHYKNGVCSKYFGWCTEEQCDYWQKEL